MKAAAEHSSTKVNGSNSWSNAFASSVRARLTTRGITIICAVLLFILLCVSPILYMLALSFTDNAGNFGFGSYRRLFFDARQRELLLNSTLLGTGAACVATFIGAPLGFLLARADLPAKRLLRVFLVVPLVIPPYIFALAWILFINNRAPVWAAESAYSLTGAVLVLGGCFFPLSMLATEAAVRRVDGRMEEAALLVAPVRRVLWRITFPLVAPVVAATWLVIFVLAIAEFGVPGLLRVRVYTTEVFTAFAALYDFGAATTLAAPMIIVTLIAALTAKAIVGERLLTGRRNTGAEGLRVKLERWRFAALGGVGCVLLASVCVPLTVLLSEAVGVKNFAVAAGSAYKAIVNSLTLATIGATLVCALAVILGYARARTNGRWGWMADVALIVMFAVPSTIIGVGIIGLWNRSGLPGEIYASQGIIVVTYLARFTPIAALMLATSVRQIPVSFEEAAEVAGASWRRTFKRIVLPNMKAGLAATWVTIFIFAFGELGATLLVAPPGESTLPVRVYTLIANTSPAEVAALALLQAGVVLIPLVALGLTLRGSSTKAGGV